MELKVDQPALAGQNIDPAAFQRVWDRVMPEQAAARENTSIPDTAVPAEPTRGGTASRSRSVPGARLPPGEPMSRVPGVPLLSRVSQRPRHAVHP